MLKSTSMIVKNYDGSKIRLVSKIYRLWALFYELIFRPIFQAYKKSCTVSAKKSTLNSILPLIS